MAPLFALFYADCRRFHAAIDAFAFDAAADGCRLIICF